MADSPDVPVPVARPAERMERGAKIDDNTSVSRRRLSRALVHRGELSEKVMPLRTPPRVHVPARGALTRAPTVESSSCSPNPALIDRSGSVD
jgi:hypothetical protein